MNFKQATDSDDSEDRVDHISPTKSKIPSERVNINALITRYKKEKAKEKTETFIFVGLACGLVIISGILVSL